MHNCFYTILNPNGETQFILKLNPHDYGKDGDIDVGDCSLVLNDTVNLSARKREQEV